MSLEALFFAALYISEGWYDQYRATGRLYARARAVVLFDRVITGRILTKAPGEW